MPRGKSSSYLRAERYAKLRVAGVPRKAAILVRDWSFHKYLNYLLEVEAHGYGHADG